MMGEDLLRALIASQGRDPGNWPRLTVVKEFASDGSYALEIYEQAFPKSDPRPLEIGFAFGPRGKFKGMFNWKQ